MIFLFKTSITTKIYFLLIFSSFIYILGCGKKTAPRPTDILENQLPTIQNFKGFFYGKYFAVQWEVPNEILTKMSIFKFGIFEKNKDCQCSGNEKKIVEIKYQDLFVDTTIPVRDFEFSEFVVTRNKNQFLLVLKKVTYSKDFLYGIVYETVNQEKSNIQWLPLVKQPILIPPPKINIEKNLKENIFTWKPLQERWVHKITKTGEPLERVSKYGVNFYNVNQSIFLPLNSTPLISGSFYLPKTDATLAARYVDLFGNTSELILLE